jgi:hypothetical protein
LLYGRRERLFDLQYIRRLRETEFKRVSLIAGARPGVRYERYLGRGLAVEAEGGPRGLHLALAWYPLEDRALTLGIDLQGPYWGWTMAYWPSP